VTETTYVYACPLCQRARSSDGAPFTRPSRVEAHIDRASDAPHAGERGHAHREAIERNAIADAGVRADGGEPSDVEDDSDGEQAAGPQSQERTPVGSRVSLEGEQPTIAYADGERPLGEVLEELDTSLATLNGKFNRIAQEQRHQIEELEETVEIQKLAIQELQAGMEALAEEHDRDVDYAFELDP
jgi:hypothetical protein